MSANAAGPGVVSLNSTMTASEGGVIHQMWIPCVVFAHAFAGYFLLGMLIVMYPKAWADLKRKLFCRGTSKEQHVHSPKGRLASAGSAEFGGDHVCACSFRLESHCFSYCICICRQQNRKYLLYFQHGGGF